MKVAMVRVPGTGDSTATAIVATAPTVRVAGVIGDVAPFSGKEEWIDYAERLEHYFIANDITDVAKKRAILLNAAGAPGTTQSTQRPHF